MSKRQIIKSYNASWQKYGDSHLAAQWGNPATQRLRFKVLCEIAPLFKDKQITILDYGCGLGDLFKYLSDSGFAGQYIGVDINKNFIDYAKQKYGRRGAAKFFLIEGEEDIKKMSYDFCLISGVFNNKESGGPAGLKKAVSAVFKHSRRGAAFNALSSYAAKRDNELAYFNPLQTTKFCLDKLTKLVILRHDWRGGNFAVYLYKDATEKG